MQLTTKCILIQFDEYSYSEVNKTNSKQQQRNKKEHNHIEDSE